MWSRVWVAHEVLAALRQVKEICTPAVQSLRRGCGDPAACSAALCAGVMPCHFPTSGGLTSRDSAREGRELCSFTKAGFEDAQPLGSKGGACRTSPEGVSSPRAGAAVLPRVPTGRRGPDQQLRTRARLRGLGGRGSCGGCAGEGTRRSRSGCRGPGEAERAGAGLGAGLQGAGVVLLGDREDAP